MLLGDPEGGVSYRVHVDGSSSPVEGDAQRFVREPGVLWRRAGTAVVVLPAATEALPMQLVDEAARLWFALAEPIDFDGALAASTVGSAELATTPSLKVAGLLGMWLMAGLISECQ